MNIETTRKEDAEEKEKEKKFEGKEEGDYIGMRNVKCQDIVCV